MSIQEQLRRLIGRGGAKNKHKSEDTVLAYTEDGHAQRESEILSFLSEEYRRRRDERLPLERQWTLNADFFAGRQHCAINPENGEIQPFSPLHSYEEQGVYNRIAPLIETRLASLRTFQSCWVLREQYEEQGPYIVYRKCY